MTANEFRTFLEAARRRRWAQVILRRTALGLALGSGLGLGVSAVCLVAGIGQVTLWVGLAVSLGSAAGLILGLAGRPSLAATAWAVDEGGGLKDRIHSALQFSAEDPVDVYRALQLWDATRALRSQSVPVLFPWRWPREGTWAATGLALAVIAGLAVPEPPTAEATLTGPPEVIVAEAKALANDVDRFEQLCEELDSAEMKALAEKLRRMLTALQEDARTGEDAMVQLAKMTSAVESAAAAFDPLLLEQELHEMAEGMQALDGYEAAARMLKQNRYDRAAKALQQLGSRIGEGNEAMPPSGGLVDVRIGQLATQVGAAGLSELSDALRSLHEAIRTGSRKACQSALRRVAGVIGKYGRRSKVGRAMRGMLARIGQCKDCVGGGCQGRGRSFGPPSLVFSESEQGSQRAGTAAAMNLFGQQTELASGRLEAQVSAHASGEGPSEVETETSVDGRQQAARTYRQVYAKYRKISDAVMTEEAIPLAHRQIIKRYFERIRPSRVEAQNQLRDVARITDGARQEIPEDESE